MRTDALQLHPSPIVSSGAPRIDSLAALGITAETTLNDAADLLARHQCRLEARGVDLIVITPHTEFAVDFAFDDMRDSAFIRAAQ
jgi:hypothetical protein